MYPIDTYKNRQVDFPKHDVPVEKRDKKWHKDWCEAIYSQYLRDTGNIGYSQRNELKSLRLYAEGNQPVEKYMDILCPKDDKTHQRKGYMNISWDIFSLAPKYKDLIVGKFDKQHHDIIAEAVDESSGAEKEKMKFSLYAESTLRDFLQTIPEEYQVMNPNLDGMLPESLGELEMYDKAGSFKLNEEIAIEKILRHSFDISNWDEEIKRNIYGDFFDMSMGGCKDYVDKQTKKVKVRYVDPVNAIYAKTRSNNISDNSPYFGEVLYPTIEQIRNEAGGQLNEKELKDIAKRFRSYNGRSDMGYSSSYQYDYNDKGYDDIRGCVLDVEWDSVKTVKHSKRTRNGKTITKEIKPGQRVHKKNTETFTTQIKIIHKAKWVVGTPYLYDFGVQEDIPRPDPKEAKKSFHFWKHSNKSHMARIIPNMDEIQMATLKLRNAMATAVPRGIAVEFGSLEGMSMGGQKMGPLDILTIRRQTGDTLYKMTSHHNKIKTSGYKPITETEGGIGPQLNEFITIMETNVSMINRILGFNELSSADTPAPRTGVGVSKIAEGATNNVLQNLYSGYKNIKQSTATNIFLRAQILIGNNQGDAYLKVIGKPAMKITEISKSITSRQMGIKLELRPDDTMKLEILNAAKESHAAGRQGAVGIDYSDYLYIVSMIESGDVKKARLVLAYKEQKQREKQEAIQQQNMLLNSQMAQETEAQKAKNKTREIYSIRDADALLEEKKSGLRMAERKSTAVDDMDKKEHEKNLDARNEQLKENS